MWIAEKRRRPRRAVVPRFWVFDEEIEGPSESVSDGFGAADKVRYDLIVNS
jgi:hypothetical protein